MRTTDLTECLTGLFAELVYGAKDAGAAFVLNSGDAGLVRSIHGLSAAQASSSANGGATIAAHVRHVSYGLSLMNRWMRDGGNPFADAKWDDAWTTSGVDEREWGLIRSELAAEASAWSVALGDDREVTATELSGMIASVAHLAYHLGAIRQIDKNARGPREGTFA